MCAMYCTNRQPKEVDDEIKTRYELHFGKKPNIGNLRKFGAKLATLTRKHGILKFGDKTKTKHFVGYTDKFNTYRVYDAEEIYVTTSCDVAFVENDEEQTSVLPIRHEENEVSVKTTKSLPGKDGEVNNVPTNNDIDMLRDSNSPDLVDIVNVDHPVNFENDNLAEIRAAMSNDTNSYLRTILK